MSLRCFVPGALLLALTSPAALAQNHWVATWGAASLEQPISALENIPPAGLTYRNIIHTSLGGSQVRVTVSNVFGGGPLNFNDTNIAVATSAGNGAVNPNTINRVTFGGLHQVSIPAGQIMVSDPVTMNIPQDSDLAVSFHVTQAPTTSYTDHDNGRGQNFYLAGDHSGDTTLPANNPFTQAWHFLSAVDVMAPANASAIVIIGDSTTDGAGDGDTDGSNNRWPNFFYSDLVTNGVGNNFSVVNEGMGSDRVVTDGGLDALPQPDKPQPNDELLRPSALHRFGRDVLQRAGVKYIIILEGVNDIDAIDRGPTITESQLEQAYQTMLTQAHNQDPSIKVIIATMTPLGNHAAEGSDFLNFHIDVNNWIRSNQGLFDGFIDIEQATGVNLQTTDKYKVGDGSSDGLHPSVQGKHDMADTAAANPLFN